MTLVHCLGCAGLIPVEARVCPSCSSTQDSAGARPADPGTLWASVEQRLGAATADKYEVRGLLGYGGMAAVFLARDPKLDRLVAIKVMSPALMTEHRMVERFMTEAMTIARLRHPNIVTIFDVDDGEGLHFFVMSYVDGRPLQSLIVEEGQLDFEVTRHWIGQVADALAYAHGQGIIHRDIKPANILIDEDGQALVVDLGIAKVTDQEGLTRAGVIIGTPAYISPEQYRGAEASPQSDQYALGVVAYEMLTGAPPITGSVHSITAAHVTDKPLRPLLEARPLCPPDLATAIHRMLTRDPGDRWPSLEDIRGAIGAAPLDRKDPLVDTLKGLVRGRTVASLELSPLPDSLSQGETGELEVWPLDQMGDVVQGRPVVIGSTDPSIASVTVDGLIRGRRPGRVTLVARSGLASRAIPLEVTPAPVHEVDVSPSTVTFSSQEPVHFQARVMDAEGRVLEGRAVSWRVSDPSVARIDESGVVERLGEGTVQVIASIEGVEGAASLVVPPASEEVSDPDSQPTVAFQGVETAGWRGGEGTSGPASGLVGASVVARAAVPGSPAALPSEGRPPKRVGWRRRRGWLAVSTVVATAATVFMFWLLGLGQSVARVVVEIPQETLRVGEEVLLTAFAMTSEGAPVEGLPITWRVTDPSVGRIHESEFGPFFVAISPGPATVEAEIEGVTGTVGVYVIETKIALVRAPGADEIEPGDKISVWVTDQADQVVEATFSSSDLTVARVSEEGVVEALAEGPVTIFAYAFGDTAQADLRVQPPPIEPIELVDDLPAEEPERTPEPEIATVAVVIPLDALRVGEEVPVTASATTPGGEPVDSVLVDWRVTDPTIGRVDVSGSEAVFVALAAGEARVEAVVQGVTGTAPVSVIEAVRELRLSPEEDELLPGDTVTVLVTDQTGRRIQAEFNSSDTTVVRVSEDGLVEARAVGRALVTVSVSGVNEQAEFTVLQLEAPPTVPLVDPDSTYYADDLTERPEVLHSEVEYLRRVEDHYPARLRGTGIGGVVLLELTIGRDGRVEDVQVVETGAHALLVAAARNMALSLTFSPPRRFGVDVRTWGIELPVRFNPGR